MENKDGFLKNVARQLLKFGNDGLFETVVVFPNIRPKIFLKKHMTELAGKTIWMPEMLSVDEFLSYLSEYSVQDTFLTWIELYSIHKELEKENKRELADFLKWAPIMLNDFNEADEALVDIEKLFSYLYDVKKIEQWQPDKGEPSEFINNYLRFYSSLSEYHKRLKHNLQKKGLLTRGMQYRYVAETISGNKNLKWKNIIFAGFNALTPAEKKIIGELYKQGNTRIFWDIDEYYFNPEKYGLSFQEAGKFLRKNIKDLKISNPQWIIEKLATDKKDITIIAAPKKTAQIKVAAQIVSGVKENDIRTPEKTAIVLADESLLLPLLISLPDDIAYNVTMGYPLAKSHLANAVEQWLEISILSNKSNGSGINTSEVISLLRNPLIRMLFPESVNFLKSVKNTGSAFVSEGYIKELIVKEKAEGLGLLFRELHDTKTFLESFLLFVKLLKNKVSELEDNLGEEKFSSRYPLLKQQIAAMLTVVKKLHIVVEESSEKIDLETLEKILTKLISSTEVSLKGEPLNGIQVMGLLETRLLDFDNIIMLGVNEGNIPKTGFNDTFIPLDIRREFGIKLPYDKTAIFAYYFFRLLQRAENAKFIYDSEPGSVGGGEKSRFLYQLEMELAEVNKNINIKELFFKNENIEVPEVNNIVIEKDEPVIKKLSALVLSGEKGLSASSINTFVECPVKFYFLKIAGLKQPDELKTSIESDLFGTLVHYILEKIYKPFTGKNIDPGILKKELDNIEIYLKEALEENLTGQQVNTGKNLLILGVIKKFVKRFIEHDINQLKREPKELVSVELELNTTVHVDKIGDVTITGKIDRVDKIPGSENISIIDYKTGKVEKKDVKIKDWADFKTDRKLAKAFQTLLYGWMFRNEVDNFNDITVGLYSLRKISEGFIEPEFPDNGDNPFIEFEKVLKEIILEMFDTGKPFECTDDTDVCQYCEFKNICGR